MAKTYKGTLSLDWYNKQQSILLREKDDISLSADVPAPKINWVNKDEALFYEIDSEGGIGQTPYWVERNDIRVKEARPLILQKVFKAVAESKPGTLQGMDTTWKVVESKEDDPAVENILIKGDNLLALNTLKKMFSNKPEEEKVKCMFVDVPYNIDVANPDYDDNLAHSEWLTLMRDRLLILKELLRLDGSIWIAIDEEESHYLKVLCDDIFGRQNFISQITVKRSAPTGHKAINPSPVQVSDLLLFYAKDKPSFKYQIQYTAREYDDAYDKFIANFEKGIEEWSFMSLKTFLSEKNISIEECLNKYADRVIRFAKPDYGGVGQDTRDIIDESKKHRDKIFIQKREGYPDIFIRNGDRILFYKDKLKVVDNKLVTAEPLTNIWLDIPYQGIAKEGSVVFKKSKKPEKLIKRCLEICTNEGDLVLDSFLGSGTTSAVAAKLKRRWIGVEIGNHADTHVVPRLKSVIEGLDQSGISKLVSWKGGGSFKYYHLGQSIITINEDGTGDFNWSLGKKFIEESFLSSYDYTLDKTINLSEGQLFRDEENAPSIGVQAFGTKKRVAVITLNQPGGKNDTLTYDEIFHIYSTIKKNLNPEYINIFTNKGLELAYDSKPEDLDVIKVPHAIFSELEK